MPAVTIDNIDLAPFAEIPLAKAEAMIADALALAVRVAPCILKDDFTAPDAARAILRGAVLRWHEAGSGALQSSQVGPFGMALDTRQQRRGLFWPSEIEQLQGLCRSGEQSGAFAVDTAGGGGIVHADVCSVHFGGLYCSCGAVLTGGNPLWEVEP